METDDIIASYQHWARLHGLEPQAAIRGSFVEFVAKQFADMLREINQLNTRLAHVERHVRRLGPFA